MKVSVEFNSREEARQAFTDEASFAVDFDFDTVVFEFPLDFPVDQFTGDLEGVSDVAFA